MAFEAKPGDRPARAASAYSIADLPDLPGVPCPCGTARRAFADELDYPATVHLTEIAADARTHYHRRISETYVILEAEAGAGIELNGRRVAAVPGRAILIRPGTRHRAVGKMKVLIFCTPKFDPHDEWFD